MSNKQMVIHIDIIITIWYVPIMKTKIFYEMTEFLQRTSLPVRKLAEEAGVAAPILTRVLTGERDDMYSRNADRVRDAMLRLSSSTPPAGKEGSDG